MPDRHSTSKSEQVHCRKITRRRILRSILVTAATATTSIVGCKVGPDFHAPKGPRLAEEFHQSLVQNVPPEDALLDDQSSCWWSYFNDDILVSLLSDANLQNLSIREAYFRISESRALLGLSKSQFFPQFNGIGDSNYKRFSSNTNQQSTSSARGAFMNYANGIDSSWEIDLWGRIARGVEAANADLLAQHESLHDIRVTLQADVASTYVQIRVLQQRLIIAKQNLELQQQTLHIVGSRQQAGLVGQLDQSEAESNVAVTSASIPPIQQELQTALYRLCVLLGQTPSGDFVLEDRFGELPMAVIERIHPSMPASLLNRRPDIRKGYFDVMAANARIGIAVADRLPTLTIRGSISVEARNVNILYTDNSLAHSVGPGLRWNFLNFGRLKRNIEAREANHQQAVVRYEALVLKGVQEVESGLVEFDRQKQRVLELERVVEATTRSVEISLARYEQNLITFDRVLDAQRSLASAQGNLAVARGDILFALIKTYKALGGGWQDPIWSPTDVIN